MAPQRHVVISTASGTGQAQNFYDSKVADALKSLGLEEGEHFTVHSTESEGTVTDLTRDIFLPAANGGTKQVVILLSGDGGIVDMVNALLASSRAPDFTPPTVVLLPLGTGNALANSLGITADDGASVRSLLTAGAHRLPILKATFSPGARILTQEGSRETPLHRHDGRSTFWGAVVASWGVHASLVADSDTAEYRKYGAERFAMAAKAALYPADGSPPHGYLGRVSVSRGGEWRRLRRRGALAYVLATLVSNLEKTFAVSPASRPLDARLRLVHFGAMAGDEVMDIMKKAYDRGAHVDDERVGYEEIEGLRIHFDEDGPDGRWRRVCVDGKIIRVERGGWLEVTMEEAHVLDIVCNPERRA